MGGEIEDAKVQRIVRVRVASAAKVGGTLGCVLGLLGGLGAIVYMLRVAAPGPDAAPLPLVLSFPVLAAGVAGLDGLLLGALCAWTFNATAWLTGGLAIDLEAGLEKDV